MTQKSREFFCQLECTLNLIIFKSTTLSERRQSICKDKKYFMANKTSGKKHDVAYKHQFAFTSNLIETNTTKYFSSHWDIQIFVW